MTTITRVRGDDWSIPGAIAADGTAVNLTGGSVSLIVPIGAVDAPWVEIDIDMGGATEVRYRLQAHWVAPLAVVDGVCGG